MIRIRVRNVAEAEIAVRKLRTNVTRIKEEVAAQLVAEMPRRMERAVKGRVYPYPSNTVSTLASKRGATPLIDEKNYIKSWHGEVFRQTAGQGAFFKIMFEPRGVNPARGIPNSQLALWLDQGTKRMPARPHILPFMVDMQRLAETLVRRKVLDVLRR